MNVAPIAKACVGCGYRAYPARLLCPRCGSGEWTEEAVRDGVVLAVTEVRSAFRPRRLPSGAWIRPGVDPPRIALVEAAAGVRLVARAPRGVEVGDRVELVAEPGRVVARRR
jgi:uncharacterized OB-fold protein